MDGGSTQPGNLLRLIAAGDADKKAEVGLPHTAAGALRAAGIDPATHEAALRAVMEALPGNANVELLSRHFGELVRALMEEKELNNEDFLTGAKSRRWFFARLEGLQKKAQRASQEERPFSLIMLDIDFFKRVNDTHGHVAGDAILQQLVARIKGALREGDDIARYGGEEFCIVTVAKNGEADGLAERIRKLVEEKPFTVRYGAENTVTINITVSMGVASFYPNRDREGIEVVHRADGFLYDAKRSGRNRVVTERPPVDMAEPDGNAAQITVPTKGPESPRETEPPEKGKL